MDRSKITIDFNNSVFYLNSQIGEGGQGSIFSAMNPIEKKSLAVKIVDLTKPIKKMNFRNETTAIHILKPWKYKYLCEVLDYFEKDNIGYVAMEKYDCDLFTYAVETHDGLSEELGKSIFRKICLGIMSMHHENIAHLDIKPENIMYNISSNTPYIGDFGACYVFKDKKKCNVLRGTKYFNPPEYAEDKPFDPKRSDIYSLGVTLHVLLTGYFPYDISEDIDKRRIFILPELSPSCRNLILKMIRKNPKRRISLKEVLNHPWLSDKSNAEEHLLTIRSATSILTKRAKKKLHKSLQKSS